MNGTGVWFTSIKDDSRGGDTNGNGNLNTPAVGGSLGVFSCDIGNHCKVIKSPNE